MFQDKNSKVRLRLDSISWGMSFYNDAYSCPCPCSCCIPTLCLVPFFHMEGRKQEEDICEGDLVLELLPLSPFQLPGPHICLVIFRIRLNHNLKLLSSHQAHESLALTCLTFLAKSNG